MPVTGLFSDRSTVGCALFSLCTQHQRRNSSSKIVIARQRATAREKHENDRFRVIIRVLGPKREASGTLQPKGS
jgi:hypothetical protein